MNRARKIKLFYKLAQSVGLDQAKFDQAEKNLDFSHEDFEDSIAVSLKEQIAEEMGISPEDIDMDENFFPNLTKSITDEELDEGMLLPYDFALGKKRENKELDPSEYIEHLRKYRNLNDILR